MIGAGNEENVSQLLLRKISENTDAWGDGLSIMLTVLTILASVVTIISLLGVAMELWKRKVSTERQELIIKDLIRHLLVNAAIMEVIRMKMAGKWGKLHPLEGIFSRFRVLDSDLQLDQIRVKDSEYTKLHSLSLFLRNYNIMSELAEKHFNDPKYNPKEKELELDELLKRTIRITSEFLELSKKANLKIDKGCVEDFIKKHYKEKQDERTEPLPDIQLPVRVGDRAFYDIEFDLKDVYDFCILDRYDDIRVIPFRARTIRSKILSLLAEQLGSAIH